MSPRPRARKACSTGSSPAPGNRRRRGSTAKRSPAAIAAAWEILAQGLGPSLALAPLPDEPGTPMRVERARAGYARRACAAEGDRARVAFQQFQRARERRDARGRRQRPRRAHRGSRATDRRVATGRRAGRHPALSARPERRRMPACHFRAHRFHRPGRLECRHRPRAVRASAVSSGRARGRAGAAARGDGRAHAGERDGYPARR